MLVRVQSVRPLTGFVVHVTFTDGTNRNVDLEPYLQGPVFEPIREQADLFRAVSVEYGTLTWPNGADLDPDVLYHDGTPAWARQHDQPEAA
jgi:hypothetical protein